MNAPISSFLKSALVFAMLWSDLAKAQSGEAKNEEVFIEIRFLKQVIAEQERRIVELEKNVRELQLLVAPPKTKESEGRTIRRLRPAQAEAAWQNPGSWEFIVDGMSPSQVISILGAPTSTKDDGAFKTLFFEGEVPGSGSVSGNIKFLDNRVFLVHKPVF